MKVAQYEREIENLHAEYLARGGKDRYELGELLDEELERWYQDEMMVISEKYLSEMDNDDNATD